MKKVFLLLLLTSFMGFSQSFGEYKIPEYFKSTEVKDLDNKWIDLGENQYIKKFDKSIIGLKHALEECNSILLKNELKFSKPTRDKSFVSSLVKDWNDYEMLHVTLYGDSSEVMKSWEMNGITFSIMLNKDLYMLSIAKF